MLKKHILILTLISILTLYVGDYLINDVKIIVDGSSTCISTFSNEIEEILKDNKIELRDNDYINLNKSQKISDGTILVIKSLVPIKILKGEQTINSFSYENTVKEALDEHGINYDEDDIISPELDSKILANMTIKVDKVEEKTVIEYNKIPYQSIIKYNKNFYIDTKKEVQKGEEGIVEVQKNQKFINGKLDSEFIIREITKKEPINQIIEKGSKPKVITSRSGVRFEKSMIMKASAYDLSYESTGKKPGDKYYGITASGVKAKKGIVAVDPKVIPLGTKLYIESLDGSENYGFAVAGDTGGAIKGNRIDLFYNDHEFVKKYGIKKVKVYILE